VSEEDFDADDSDEMELAAAPVSRFTVDVPQGIYRKHELPCPYDAIDAINYSSLKNLAKSPKHYQHYLTHGRAETAAMFRGTAAHIAILEPERFVMEYAVFYGPRKAGKEWKAFQEANKSKTLIKSTEFAKALAMRDSVRDDPNASGYLANGSPEVTLVWVDPDTQLKLKGRVDFLRNDRVISDVKTTRDATPLWFSRDVAKLQYHVQAAMYSDGVEVITGDRARYVVIAVEAAAPHDTVTYDLPEPVLGPGRDEYRRLLRLLIECRETRRWPGIGNGFEVALTLPVWAVGDEGDLEALGLEM